MKKCRPTLNCILNDSIWINITASWGPNHGRPIRLDHIWLQYFFIETKYDCNHSYEEKQMWLQSWSLLWQQGPNMTSMIVTAGTLHHISYMIAISVPNKTLFAPNMNAIIRNLFFPEIRPDLIKSDSKNIFEISIIQRLIQSWDCNQNRFSMGLPIIIIIAVILSPLRNYNCNHVLSIPIKFSL